MRESNIFNKLTRHDDLDNEPFEFKGSERGLTPLESSYNEDSGIFEKEIQDNLYAIGTDKVGNDSLEEGIEHNFKGNKRPMVLVDFLAEEEKEWSPKLNENFINSIIHDTEAKVYVYFYNDSTGELNTLEELETMEFINTKGTQGEIKTLLDNGFKFDKDNQGVFMKRPEETQ